MKNTLSDSEKLLFRLKNAERQRNLRAQKKEQNNREAPVAPIFVSPQVKGKLLKRTRETLRGTEEQNVSVLQSLLNERTKNVETVSKNSLIHQLPQSTIQKVNKFFYDDDISRASPNAKDFVVVKQNGERKRISVKHLMFPIKEVHGMFCLENPDEKIGLSKFSSLRPNNVLSCQKMPHNVCCCQIHENMRGCLKALQKSDPCFEDLMTDNAMHKNFVCDDSTEDCFLNRCGSCNSSARLKNKASVVMNPLGMISWSKWVKANKQVYDDHKALYCNIEKVKKTDSIKNLLEEIYDQATEYLDHQFIKMMQSQSSSEMIQEAKNPDSDLAVICCDFAEKFKCCQQNATQSAHYGQTPVSIFTVAIYHRQFIPMIIASDYEKHTKDCVLAYLDEVFDSLPSTVKTVEIWSDNATSQFKNQFIMEGIKSFQDRRNIIIKWNFYAAMHGKSVVDGIGGAVKRYVKERILGQALSVKSAEDFVNVATSMDIKVLLMNTSVIEERNVTIGLAKIVKNSKKVNDIKKNHCFSIQEKKVGKNVLNIVVGSKTTPMNQYV